jgi:hypothetical protein
MPQNAVREPTVGAQAELYRSTFNSLSPGVVDGKPQSRPSSRLGLGRRQPCVPDPQRAGHGWRRRSNRPAARLRWSKRRRRSGRSMLIPEEVATHPSPARGRSAFDGGGMSGVLANSSPGRTQRRLCCMSADWGCNRLELERLVLTEAPPRTSLERRCLWRRTASGSRPSTAAQPTLRKPTTIPARVRRRGQNRCSQGFGRSSSPTRWAPPAPEIKCFYPVDASYLWPGQLTSSPRWTSHAR